MTGMCCGDSHALAASLHALGQAARRLGRPDGVLHTWVSHSSGLALPFPIGPCAKEICWTT